MHFSDDVMHVVEIAGVAVSVVALLVSVVFQYAPLRAALAQLKFRPELEIIVNGISDRNFVYVAPLDAGDILVAQLTVKIRNRGLGTARDVNLIISMPDELYVSDVGHQFDSPSAKAQKIEVAVELEDGRLMARVMAIFPYIHGHNSQTLLDHICFRDDNDRTLSGVTETKDGMPIEHSIRMIFSYLVRVEVAAENIAPIRRDYSVQFFRPGHDRVRHLQARGPDAILPLVPKTSAGKFAASTPATAFLYDKVEPFPPGKDGAVKGLWLVRLRNALVMPMSEFKDVGYIPIRAARRLSRSEALATLKPSFWWPRKRKID